MYSKTTWVNGNINNTVMLETDETGVATYDGIREFLAGHFATVKTVCDAPLVYRAVISSPYTFGETEEIGEGSTSSEAYMNAIMKASKRAFGLEVTLPCEVLVDEPEEPLANETETKDVVTDDDMQTTCSEETEEADTSDITKLENVQITVGKFKETPTTIKELAENEPGYLLFIAKKIKTDLNPENFRQAELVRKYCELKGIEY